MSEQKFDWSQAISFGVSTGFAMWNNYKETTAVLAGKANPYGSVPTTNRGPVGGVTGGITRKVYDQNGKLINTSYESHNSAVPHGPDYLNPINTNILNTGSGALGQRYGMLGSVLGVLGGMSDTTNTSAMANATGFNSMSSFDYFINQKYNASNTAGTNTTAGQTGGLTNILLGIPQVKSVLNSIPTATNNPFSYGTPGFNGGFNPSASIGQFGNITNSKYDSITNMSNPNGNTMYQIGPAGQTGNTSLNTGTAGKEATTANQPVNSWKNPTGQKANVNIAKTTFETGPNDKLAAPDYYAGAAALTQPVNMISDPSKDGLFDYSTKKYVAINETDQKQLMTEHYTKLAVAALTTVDYKKTYEKFKSFVKNPKELLDGMGKDLMASILHGIGYRGDIDEAADYFSKIPSMFKKSKLRERYWIKDSEIDVIINDKNKRIKESELPEYEGIAYLLGELKGNSDIMKITPVGANMLLAFELLKKGIKARLDELIDEALAMVTTDSDKRQLRLSGLQYACEESYLKYIYDLIEDKDYGVGVVLACIPDIVTLILENFKFHEKEEYTNDKFSKYLVDLLFKLDKNWLSYDRNGIKIINLELLGSLSVDAHWAMQADTRTLIPSVLAGTYPPLDYITDTLTRREFAPLGKTNYS